MRAIGIDVHRDFCELAISENGRLRSAGRVPSTPEQLELLAQSLGPDDEVALETTGNALAIARIIEPHVARVVVASAKELHAITGAKAKTDRRDARTLARLLAAGLLEGTWLPDEATRALRRRLQRREQLVRQRSRLKNEIHASLYRNLAGVGPASDLFGAAGRRWLAGLALPADERETVEGCLRVLDFLGEEVERLEQAVAGQALDSPEFRRLVTIPGVNLITAATLMAVIGDVGRFASARKLVGYLGLDPRVRQSASSPARTGRILKGGRRRRPARPLRGRPGGDAHPGAAARLRAARERPARPPGGRGRRPQAGQSRVATAYKRPGLRLRQPLAGGSEAAAHRAARRCAAPARTPLERDTHHPTGTRTRARPGRRARLPAPGLRLAGQRQEGQGRGRRNGARIVTGPRGTKQRGRRIGPAVCALARGRPHPGLRSHKEVEAVENDLTFIRRHAVGTEADTQTRELKSRELRVPATSQVASLCFRSATSTELNLLAP
jgi:transposase